MPRRRAGFRGIFVSCTGRPPSALVLAHLGSSNTSQSTSPWSLWATLCSYRGVLRIVLPLRVCLVATGSGCPVFRCWSCVSGGSASSRGSGGAWSAVSLRGSMLGSLPGWLRDESSMTGGGAASRMTSVTPLRGVRRFVRVPLAPLSAAPFLMA